MEEQTTPSLEYMKGFNEGYLLAKESSTLADKLSKVHGDSERIKGFQDGRRHFVMELARNSRQEKLMDSRGKNASKTRTDKDKDLER